MAIEEDPPAGVPDWIVSFGDMMSLLLCFFVLLFSMGSTEQQKFQAMAEAMQERFGDPNPKLKFYPRTHPPLRTRKERRGPETWDNGQEFQTSESDTNREADERQRMWMQRSGQVPTVGTILEFSTHAAALGDDHRRQLAKIAPFLAGKANLIAVRGHSSPVRGSGASPEAEPVDDWDLAYARCRAVMEFLTGQSGLDAERFRLEVAGDNEPVYRGVDRQQQRRNARVELYLLNDLVGSPAIVP